MMTLCCSMLIDAWLFLFSTFVFCLCAYMILQKRLVATSDFGWNWIEVFFEIDLFFFFTLVCLLVCQLLSLLPAAATSLSWLSACAIQGTRDPLFLTGVTFPSEYPIYEETKIKLSVYDVKDKSQETVSILGGTFFFLYFHACLLALQSSVEWH